MAASPGSHTTVHPRGPAANSATASAWSPLRQPVFRSLWIAAAQAAVPPWVRERGLAVYLLVFQGGMAAGSVLWGAVAARLGIPVALIAAGAGLLLGLLVARRYRLAPGETLDLTPSLHWPEPTVLIEPPAARGPVMVAVEYRIDPAQAADFARAMREVRLERLRDGAMRWELFQDPADPQRYVEAFLAESWVEHLRQHERVTLADREAEARARALHNGPAPPTVSHLVAVRAPEITTGRANRGIIRT